MPRIKGVDDNPEYSELIKALLRHMGKDFTKCEQCTKDLPEGKANIHHTKYDGATIYDLQIVCQGCNMKPENMNLY